MTAGELPGTLKNVDTGYWRRHWRQQKLARFTIPGCEIPQKFWDNSKNVNDVYQKTRRAESWRRKAEVQIAEMDIRPGARVLDIGAGTGTLAFPLAARGCHVTAIEPSELMREGLAAYQNDEGMPEITIIPRRWEDVNIGEFDEPFDRVIASYSLTMVDIGYALERMQECCRGSVHLFWFLTPPSWTRVGQVLWPQLHGTAFHDEPLADCLWQVLFEMGIYAHMTVEPAKKPTVYPSIDLAVEEYYQRLNCSTEEQSKIIRDYFRQHMKKTSGGYYSEGDLRGAHIWWNVNGRS
ncbi:MAG: class I SAM-dependent methyltransferase [Methanoregula sp.]